jgi:hypothetical protein
MDFLVPTAPSVSEELAVIQAKRYLTKYQQMANEYLLFPFVDCPCVVMCPKSDDPVTVNQVHRQIQLDVVDGGGSGSFTGLLGISFQGSTSYITLGSPSSDNCEAVLEANAKFDDVTCTYTSVSSTARRFVITFVSWPKLPQENNIYTHNGNPASTDFLCDVSKTDSTIQCTYSDVVSTNLRGM